MQFSAYLGTAGLTDIGYRFYDVTETATAARQTAGVIDAGEGWYSVSATAPANSVSVRWDSTGTADAKAREYYLDERGGAGSTPPTVAEIADGILGRNVAGGSDGGRTVAQALYFLRNKWSISGSTLTVYGVDDTTSSWTATVGTNASADPIVSNDPA